MCSNFEQEGHTSRERRPRGRAETSTYTGFVIHSATHMAREDQNQIVMHIHSRAGMAIAAIKEGLLPYLLHASHFQTSFRPSSSLNVRFRDTVRARAHGFAATDSPRSLCWRANRGGFVNFSPLA